MEKPQENSETEALALKEESLREIAHKSVQKTIRELKIRHETDPNYQVPY